MKSTYSSTRLSRPRSRFAMKAISGLCVGAMGLALAGVPAATQASASSKTNINFWFWGESDIPGITKWMTQRIALYEKANPGVAITVVPQSNTTII